MSTTKALIGACADNIQRLPIGPITIATTTGPRKIDALLLGDWALHDGPQGWTITHQGTGYAGKFYPTPVEALISLGIYLGAGLRFPDNMTMETIGAALKDTPGIADIAERIKAALALVEIWELDLDYNERETNP